MIYINDNQFLSLHRSVFALRVASFPAIELRARAEQGYTGLASESRMSPFEQFYVKKCPALIHNINSIFFVLVESYMMLIVGESRALLTEVNPYAGLKRS